MRIESLKIKNFKIFKDILIRNIPNMAVFMGANASGKSTLFDAFGFLHDARMLWCQLFAGFRALTPSRLRFSDCFLWSIR
ncbi:MAG: AAA family ATPase [Desulfotomaculaceae bacterium]|nr:AAA family ATPase [Desulfotomaculaceae bacterium]